MEYTLVYVDVAEFRQILLAALIQCATYKEVPSWLRWCKELESKITDRAVVIVD